MAQAVQSLRIGELAEQSGMTRDTLRYYERRGLLVKPPRSPGGFRLYPPDTLDRLQFVRHAQGVGLTLDDIGTLLSFNGKRGLTHCKGVHALLTARLTELDRKIGALTSKVPTLTPDGMAAAVAFMRATEGTSAGRRWRKSVSLYRGPVKRQASQIWRFRDG